MRRDRIFIASLWFCLVLLAFESLAAGPPPQAPRAELRSEPKVTVRRPGSGMGRWGAFATNNPQIKAAFGEAVSQASAATARIFADGRPVALGTVVDRDGYLVSKASLLEGELTCSIGGGEPLAAEIVGIDEDHDLALIRVPVRELTPVSWRPGEAPLPGSLVAAVEPGNSLIGIGVVSAEPRKIDGSTRIESRRGWLGIGLGGGESGLGITSVMSGSAAEKADLRPGDLVRSINGTAMKSVDQLVQFVGDRAPGETIGLVVRRDGEEIERIATLGRPEPRQEPQDHWGGGPFSERRFGFPLAIPHDTVIHPSDCGGPLVDTSGQVVGVNIARALRVTTYAIPAGVVQRVVQNLRGRGLEARRQMFGPAESP